MELTAKQKRLMRDYFTYAFGLDPDDDGIEWYIDAETPTTYSWVFLLKDKKVIQTLNTKSLKITHKELKG